MAHGISNYETSLEALTAHARGGNVDGTTMKAHVDREINASGDTDSIKYGALLTLRPDDYVKIEEIYGHERNSNMRANIETIRKHSYPKSTLGKIAAAKEKAETSRAAYIDARNKHINITPTKEAEFDAAAKASDDLRINQPSDEERISREKECAAKWAKAAGSENSSQLQGLYERHLDHRAEHERLRAKSPADFIEDEQRHSIREFAALEKKLSETDNNSTLAFHAVKNRTLSHKENAALDTYRQKMCSDDEGDIQEHRKTLREAFHANGEASPNLGKLNEALDIEDLHRSAKAEKEKFTAGSKDLRDFLAEKDRKIAKAREIGYKLGEGDASANLEHEDSTSENTLQEVESARRSAEATAAAKTKEAKSQRTQKHAWIGGTTAVTLLSLGAVAFILNKQSQIAKQASYGQ